MRNLPAWAAVVMLLSGGAILGVAGEEPTASPSPAPAASPEIAQGPAAKEERLDPRDVACLVDPSALEDLKKQRQALQAKEKEIEGREAELRAREQALIEELKKIQEVRNDIGKVDSARKRENDEKVTKLVETFETMSPKAAAQVLASLDDTLAVATIARMATPRLAKVMNVMEPKRSTRLTELLAGVVRVRDIAPGKAYSTASDDAAATTTPGTGIRKGGEKNNDEQNK